MDELEGMSREDLIKTIMQLQSSKRDQADDASETESLLGDFVKPKKILLDGNCLTPEELVAIGYDPSIAVDLSPAAWAHVARSRQIVDNILVRAHAVTSEIPPIALLFFGCRARELRTNLKGVQDRTFFEAPASRISPSCPPSRFPPTPQLQARNEVVYGINTGFGNFANVIISPERLKALQVRREAYASPHPGVMCVRLTALR